MVRLRNQSAEYSSSARPQKAGTHRSYSTADLHVDVANSHATPKSREPSLKLGLTAAEAEPWQRWPYIETGYRLGGTNTECIASLFRWHNETVNAWTMILSILTGTVLLLYYAATVKPKGLDISPFVVMWLSQASHSFFSICYHTFSCQSAVIEHSWRQLDQSFISVLHIGTTYGLCYFTFGFRGSLIASGLISVFALRGILSFTHPHLTREARRKKVLQSLAVTAQGCYIPVVYRGIWSAVYLGRAWPELTVAAGMLLLHGIGLLTYAFYWPQRQFPRVFDIIGFSHNIMHVCIFAVFNWGYPYLAWLYTHQHEYQVSDS